MHVSLLYHSIQSFFRVSIWIRERSSKSLKFLEYSLFDRAKPWRFARFRHRIDPFPTRFVPHRNSKATRKTIVTRRSCIGPAWKFGHLYSRCLYGGPPSARLVMLKVDGNRIERRRYSNGGAKNRGVDDVSRSRAKVINYTGYLTPNDRLASRMLTSRHHATCYARAPPARVLNQREMLIFHYG